MDSLYTTIFILVTGHFHIFDGLGYSFNGTDDWMIKREAEINWNKVNQFACQVRLEPYTKAVEDRGIDNQVQSFSDNWGLL